jgi:hypothetical protein
MHKGPPLKFNVENNIENQWIARVNTSDIET